jgi:hypothetical protein
VESTPINERHILNVLNILRFAAGIAIISAAVTGAIGLDDSHQIATSSVFFSGALIAKLAHLV